MTTLSTHVLDTSVGRPAAGIAFTLWHDSQVIFSGVTDGDGRCPALRDLELSAGEYRLEFVVAPYFRAQGHALSDPPFLDLLPLAFGMGADGHYHVPLLLAPFGYSTYRGS